MRRILPFLLFATVTACAFPETRWEKDGADEVLTANDLGYCRAAARNEAFTAYPYGFGSPFYGFQRWSTWDGERLLAESRLTQFCMRAKGYQLVTVGPPHATASAK